MNLSDSQDHLFFLIFFLWSPDFVCWCFMLQYLPHVIKSGKNVFDRFAVIFAVVIVWIYAHLLTVGGAYNGAAPTTQTSCRTDRAGIIGAAPW